MAVTAMRNPKVTLNMIPRDQIVGLDDHRILVVGQKLTAGAATAGALTTDVPRSLAEIEALFGAGSHISMILRKMRDVNKYTRIDAIALADNGSGVAGTSKITPTGTATEARRIYVDVVSSEYHSYQIDVVVGETVATFVAKVVAAVGLDTHCPFTAAATDTNTTVTFTAKSKGTLSNAWLLRLRDEYNRPARVAGLTFALTAWASGATDPVLTGVLDVAENIRYQSILWPQAYATAVPKAFINARFNLDNDIKDGVVFQYNVDTFSNVKATALAMNSPSWVLLTNETMNTAYWKGPHVPEAPDVITASFVAARARRFEQDISISDLVVNNERRDQFGGRHTASLPLFNTPFLNSEMPDEASGYIYAEQLELEANGVSVIGHNEPNNAVIAGVIVTTYINDAAGNPDDTWKWLEWRDTHSVIREFFVNNLREDFSQHRMSVGATVANLAMATPATIKAAAGLYYDLLSLDGLTVKGRDYRKIFDEGLQVEFASDRRTVYFGADCPMVSQLGAIIGTIKFNFKVAE